jgi:F-type H+-transporting ATPase subunit epsilon
LSFGFSLLTPESALWSGEAQEVTLRAEGGDIAFLGGHVPFIGIVQPCECRVISADGQETLATVEGGVIEVAADHSAWLAATAGNLGSGSR